MESGPGSSASSTIRIAGSSSRRADLRNNRYFSRMRLGKSFCVLAVLGLSACNLLNGKCTYELRTTQASGQLDQNGSTLAAAQVTLSEQRGSLQGQSLNWLVTSTDLKGHVTSASFKDSSTPGQVLLNLPLAAADRPEITQ